MSRTARCFSIIACCISLAACSTATIRPVALVIRPDLSPTAKIVDQRGAAERARKTAQDPGDSSVMLYGDDVYRDGFAKALAEALEQAHPGRINGKTVTVTSFALRESTRRVMGNVQGGPAVDATAQQSAARSGAGGAAGAGLGVLLIGVIESKSVPSGVSCSLRGELDGVPFALEYQGQGGASYANFTLRYCLIGLAEKMPVEAPVSSGQPAAATAPPR